MDLVYKVANYNKIYTVPESNYGENRMIGANRKAVNEIYTVGNDWVNVLEYGDGIAASVWNVTPAGLGIYDSTISGTVVKTTISGGVEGQVYALLNNITTSGNYKYEVTKNIIVSSK